MAIHRLVHAKRKLFLNVVSVYSPRFLHPLSVRFIQQFHEFPDISICTVPVAQFWDSWTLDGNCASIALTCSAVRRFSGYAPSCPSYFSSKRGVQGGVRTFWYRGVCVEIWRGVRGVRGVQQNPWIRGHSKLLEMAHDRSHTSSYSSCIVTMAVSCIIFEIKRYIGRKTSIFIPPSI